MEHLIAAENSPEPEESEQDMVMIELSYQNNMFSTFVSKPLLRVLESDQKSLESYAKLVYDREFGGDHRNMECDPFALNQPPNSASTETITQSQVSVANEDKFQWTSKSTLLLIDIRLSMEKDFIKPTGSKKKLWKNIATTLSEMGYKVSDVQCDNKYRNLLYTYRLNKKKQQTSGEGSLTWEYFEKFNQVLGHKESSHPSPVNLGASMTLPKSKIPESQDCLVGSVASISTITSDEPNTESNQNSTEFTIIRGAPRTPRKKRQEILSTGRYFYLKHKRLEELEKKREEFRKQKWADEMELRLKEIEAINNLADAIKSSK